MAGHQSGELPREYSRDQQRDPLSLQLSMDQQRHVRKLPEVEEKHPEGAQRTPGAHMGWESVMPTSQSREPGIGLFGLNCVFSKFPC